MAACSRQLHGVPLFGDRCPVDADSADVRGDQFRLDCRWARRPTRSARPDRTGGCRPTAGRDRGRISGGCEGAAQRGLFDGYRIDHLVGFYRTYAIPRDGSAAFFSPAVQREQEALGERVPGLFRSAGSEIIAEDLGTVPDFVRGSLARQGVPGFRVLRCERHWPA